MSNTKDDSLIVKKVNRKQMSDSGMAFVLICLILGFWFDRDIFFMIAVPALLINMIVPAFYYFFAIFWLSLANISGAVVSRIVLSVLYIFILTPVGLFRRLFGKDSLQLGNFKRSTSSVMKVRNYKFTAKDIETPF